VAGLRQAEFKAGIKEGDLLRTLNGEKLNSREKLQSILAELAAGDKITFEITRDGRGGWLGRGGRGFGHGRLGVLG
jgi:type II secretory pathway component PulC